LTRRRRCFSWPSIKGRRRARRFTNAGAVAGGSGFRKSDHRMRAGRPRTASADPADSRTVYVAMSALPGPHEGRVFRTRRICTTIERAVERASLENFRLHDVDRVSGNAKRNGELDELTFTPEEFARLLACFIAAQRCIGHAHGARSARSVHPEGWSAKSRPRRREWRYAAGMPSTPARRRVGFSRRRRQHVPHSASAPLAPEDSRPFQPK